MVDDVSMTRPIIMTHIGRPYDKKTGKITIKKDDDSVDAVVAYLQHKLRIKFVVPQFHVGGPGQGIHDIDTSINWLIQDLRSRKIGGIYLPNTRWFEVHFGSPPYYHESPYYSRIQKKKEKKKDFVLILSYKSPKPATYCVCMYVWF